MAVDLCRFHDHTIYGLFVLCHRQRSDFRLQYTDGIVVDIAIDRMCIQLVDHLLVVFGIGRFDKIGRFGALKSKNTFKT